MRFVTIQIIILLVFTSCNTNKNTSGEDTGSLFSVNAQIETRSLPRAIDDDSADDPAILVNFSMPDSSRIIGTDKKGGLAVYDLSGKEIFYYNTGLVNNVDLRYRFPLGSDTIDILAVTNRTDQTVDLYQINNDGSLLVKNKQPLFSGMSGEIYGLCMYLNRVNYKFYVFVNSKIGEVEQWELNADADKINGRIVRRLKLKTQVEGMVADDETGFLYIGEEDSGIWRFEADPSKSGEGILLDQSSENNNKNIKFDIEGLAIYNLSDSSGYLIASSQGNNSFAVFDRNSPNKYIGSFKISSGKICDGSEGTDGLDVTNVPLGINFPNGLLVVQDGHNDDNGIHVSQNYKFVRWDSIALKFNPSLNY